MTDAAGLGRDHCRDLVGWVAAYFAATAHERPCRGCRKPLTNRLLDTCLTCITLEDRRG